MMERDLFFCHSLSLLESGGNKIRDLSAISNVIKLMVGQVRGAHNWGNCQIKLDVVVSIKINMANKNNNLLLAYLIRSTIG